MLRVLLCWTTGVSSEEASAVQLGIRQVLQHVPGESSVDLVGRACDADLWQERCLKESGTNQIFEDCLFGQINSWDFLQWRRNRLMTEGSPAGSLRIVNVVVVDADLRSRDTNFLFGATRDHIGTVLSVHCLRRIRRLHVRRKVLERLARHEFGHALGLVPEGRQTNVEEKIGLHCTNVCTMRQSMCLRELEELTLEEARAGAIFCSECADYLRTVAASPNPHLGGAT